MSTRGSPNKDLITKALGTQRYLSASTRQMPATTRIKFANIQPRNAINNAAPHK